MTNKKFNIIFGLVGLALLVVLINILYIYRRNEASKIMFNINSVTNKTWVNEEAKFKIDKNKLTLTINDEDIINNKEYDFNNRNGMLSSDNKTLYLRSVSDDSIILWYDRVEYNLELEVIAR